MKSIKSALESGKGKETYNAAMAAGAVGPSDKVSPSELWVQLSSRKTRPHQVFDFPRKNDAGEPIGKIAIIVPTAGEIMAWNVEVEKRLQKMYKDGGLDTASADRLSATRELVAMDQILSQAVRDPDDLSSKPLAGLSGGGKPQMPSDVLSPEEMAVLYQSYLITQSNFGPQCSVITPEVYAAWLERLERGADADSFLATLTSGAMIELVKCFVATMREALRMAKCSPGSSLASAETS